MKLLEKTISRGGYTFNQLKRDQFTALYEQRDSETNELIGHEVFTIPKYEDRAIAGNFVPAMESYPGDNAFGVYAWSVGRDINRALSRYAVLAAFNASAVSNPTGTEKCANLPLPQGEKKQSNQTISPQLSARC